MSLAGDELWVFVLAQEDYVPARHLCGEPALRRSREVIRAFTWDPIVCRGTRCWPTYDGGSRAPALEFRRDAQGALRSSSTKRIGSRTRFRKPSGGASRARAAGLAERARPGAPRPIDPDRGLAMRALS